MDTATGRARALIPFVAAVIAAGYLSSAARIPALLPALAAIAPVAACALVLERRRPRRLVAVLAALLVWLCSALAGSLLAAQRGTGGLAWLAIVLFLLPLAVVPWLYFATFPSNHEPRTTNHLLP